MIRIRKAVERGHANHVCLDTCHTFSFGDYYDPAQMGLGEAAADRLRRARQTLLAQAPESHVELANAQIADVAAAVIPEPVPVIMQPDLHCLEMQFSLRSKPLRILASSGSPVAARGTSRPLR